MTPQWVRRLICHVRGHVFKFSPRACIRCGEPLPPPTGMWTP